MRNASIAFCDLTSAIATISKALPRYFARSADQLRIHVGVAESLSRPFGFRKRGLDARDNNAIIMRLRRLIANDVYRRVRMMRHEVGRLVTYRVPH